MFDEKNTVPFETDEDDFDTVMATDIAFNGNIKFTKPFMIKGRVNGTIEATSNLLIDSMAEVNADIVADNVLVRGKVKGNIKSYKMVYITSTGFVDGDIACGEFVHEPGGKFNGKCMMTGNDSL